MYAFIVKNEINKNIKNPIFWFGIIVVILGIFLSTSDIIVSQLDINKEFIELEPHELNDSSVLDGYIPTSDKEKIEIGFSNIFRTLHDVFNISDSELDILITEIQSLTLEEAIEHISNRYPQFGDIDKNFTSYLSSVKLGSYEEIKDYIDTSLEREPYTAYFSRKIIDFISVYGFVFTVLMMVKVLFDDYRKDIYELLHTKPFNSFQYIFGKCTGCFLSISTAMFIVASLYNIYGVYLGIRQGYPVNFLDMYYYLFCFIFPFILYTCATSILGATLFKNVILAIPLLFIHFSYSNFLSNKSFISGDEIIRIEYFPNIFAVIIRFPGDFFETYVHSISYVNSLLLICIAIIFLLFSCKIWERRKL